jgi:hypothetical protein
MKNKPSSFKEEVVAAPDDCCTITLLPQACIKKVVGCGVGLLQEK